MKLSIARLRLGLSILFIFCGFRGSAQSPVNNPAFSCGTKIPAQYNNWKNSPGVAQNMVSTLKHGVCLNKSFSVVFYVVLDSAGLWGALTPVHLDSMIARLNRAFRTICVSFKNCSTVVIPNYNFNNWHDVDIEPVVKNSYYTDQTINVYIPTNIISPSGVGGYAAMPAPAPNPFFGDVVVIKKSEAINSNGLTPIHEFGHFFGLVHTFAEILTNSPIGPSLELVNGSNCSTRGDGICDTEADAAGLTDANNEYYVKPVDNYMSYYPAACRFTRLQYNLMALVMSTTRLYLH